MHDFFEMLGDMSTQNNIDKAVDELKTTEYPIIIWGGRSIRLDKLMAGL